MSLSLRFLGTAASRPTVERNVAALALMREGETLLFDCGEGTQRQMMRYHVSFALADVFFTHWGPRGATRVLRRAEQFGFDRLSFPVEIAELDPDQALRRNGYDLIPFGVDHRGSASLGYALVEQTRKGRFNPELAREMGIPEGPLWGQIHRGNAVSLPDGRRIEPSVLVGPTRPGRRVVITGDTRPCAATTEMARNADLLVHEATFGEEEAARAAETGHSTAREAASVARDADVRRLVLTHFSARYSRDASELEREAREVFANVLVARDGTEIDVPYAERICVEC